MNVGVIIPDLAASEMAFYTVSQAYYLKQFSNHEPFIFVEDFKPPCIQTRVACMNISEAFNFSGVLIATTLDNASLVLNVKSNCKKIFYIWDIEWIRKGKNNFFYNVNIYRSPEFKLVCRSREHAEAIENYSNRKPDAIIPSINLMEICNGFENK